MLNKGDKINLLIEKFGNTGEGICYIDEIPVFVKYTAPGDEIEAEITVIKKNYAEGVLRKIIKPSPLRITPPCPYYGKCGGCDLMHIGYENQLKLKEEMLLNTVKHISLIDAKTENCIPSDKNTRYRNKFQAPFGVKENKVILGFFKYNTHKIIPIKDCLLQPEWVKDIIKITENWASLEKIPVYNEITSKGILRHIVVREVENRLTIILVATQNIKDKAETYKKAILELYPNSVILININKLKGNAVLSDKCVFLTSEKSLPSDFYGIKFNLSPLSFMQVNQNVMNKMYLKIIEKIKKFKRPIIIDAYSGTGLLTSSLSKYAEKTIGIEIIEQAVKDAEKIAAENGIKNSVNIQGDCAKILPETINKTEEENPGKEIILILDPPRKGLDENICKSINNCKKINEIIYISCNPATLARDLKLLNESYDIESITPFDMFPQTHHVETLVCLKRNN